MYYVIYRHDGKWNETKAMSWDDAYKTERSFLYNDIEAHIYPVR